MAPRASSRFATLAQATQGGDIPSHGARRNALQAHPADADRERSAGLLRRTCRIGCGLYHASHDGPRVPTLRNSSAKKNFGWTLPQTRREIQYLLITRTGVCAYCKAKIKRPRGS